MFAKKWVSVGLVLVSTTILGQLPGAGGPNSVIRSGTTTTEIVGGLGGEKEIVVSVKQQSLPLLEVSKQITEQLKVMVSYEDPAWVTKPGSGSIEVHAKFKDGDDAFKLAGRLLQEAIDDHHRRGNPGLFKLVKIGEFGYSIVGTNVRGENNEWLSVATPLDTRISFDEAMRDDFETVKLIVSQITAGTDLRMDLSTYGLWLSLGMPVPERLIRIGTQNETARDVLARVALESSKLRNDGRYPDMKETVRWDLLFKVGSVGAYTLKPSVAWSCTDFRKSYISQGCR